MGLPLARLLRCIGEIQPASLKIFITRCETYTGAWRHQEARLRELWAQSGGPHVLVEDPDTADLIILTDLRDDHWWQGVRQHTLPARYPGKCFAVSDADLPLPFLPGVYTSAHRGLPFSGRCRTGCYSLYHTDFQNPFVQSYPRLAFEQPKRWLFSFSGRACHPVREALFAAYSGRADCYVKDTSQFNVFSHDKNGKADNQRAFVEVLEASKFALCPRGHGASSIRLFEAMRMGVAPVIISDGWIPPKGPDWSRFAIFVKEREVAELEEIVLQHEGHYRSMGRSAAEAYYRFFADDAYFNFVVDQLADIQRSRFLPEQWFWSARSGVVFYLKLKDRVGFVARKWAAKFGQKRGLRTAPPQVPTGATADGSARAQSTEAVETLTPGSERRP